jgi:hypothetical protein
MACFNANGVRKRLLETVDDASAVATVHGTAWRESYRGIVSDEFLGSLSIQRRAEQWVSSISD